MSIPDNLLRDKDLIGKIISQCESEEILPRLPIDKLNATEVKNFLEISVKEGVESAFVQFPDEKGRLAEAVILTVGRPAILVKDNSFTVDASDVWAARLEAARANIETVIRSVGRIEVINHPRGFAYLGTGWLVAPDIIVTNRHVAEAFAKKEGAEFSFRKNTILNQKIGVNIDFREEFQVDAQEQFEALKVLYIYLLVPSLLRMMISRTKVRSLLLAIQQKIADVIHFPIQIWIKFLATFTMSRDYSLVK